MELSDQAGEVLVFSVDDCPSENRSYLHTEFAQAFPVPVVDRPPISNPTDVCHQLMKSPAPITGDKGVHHLKQLGQQLTKTFAPVLAHQ
jgi:hypothetical protein